MPLTFRVAYRQLSPLARWAIIAVIALLIMIPIGIHIYHVYKESSLVQEKAKAEKQQEAIDAKLNEANGRAHAFELQAREEAAKKDALMSTIAAGNKNVKAIEKRLNKAQENYEKSKNNLGDCGDTYDECIRLLRSELCSAGFKTENCK